MKPDQQRAFVKALESTDRYSTNKKTNMKAKDIIKHMKTIDPEEEVTAFDGHNQYSISDVHDAELQLSDTH